ncbi:MAG: hypothetical protein AAFX90_17425 [Pseudomonadota bacterium]
MTKYILMLVATLSANVLLAQENANPKIVVAVISNLSDDSLDAFYDRLEYWNHNIEGTRRPQNLIDADVIAYLPDLSSNLEQEPDQQYLSFNNDNVEITAASARADAILVETESGKLMNYIYYLPGEQMHAPLECFARHLANEAAATPATIRRKNVLQDCRK